MFIFFYFSETIKININSLLHNYESLFGFKAVSRLASYISVSEFGLTETELLELLMPTTGDFGATLKLEDGNFNFSTFCTAKKTISKRKNIMSLVKKKKKPYKNIIRLFSASSI